MGFKGRDWFFLITATLNKRGSRFKTEDKPTEDTFKNFTDSVVFKTEADDRAKEDDSSVDLTTLNGHTVLSTDAQAKNKQAKLTDRALSVQPSQLPEVKDGTQTTLINGVNVYNGSVLNVEDDVAVTTRSSYRLTMAQGFISFLNGVLNQVSSNTNSTSSNSNSISNLDGRTKATESVIYDLTEGTFAGAVPIGTMIPTAALVALPGWKILRGNVEVLATEYPDLAGLITTIPTTNVGMIRIWDAAYDDSIIGQSGTLYAPGVQRGADEEWLTNEEIPNHTHAIYTNTDFGGEHTHNFTNATGGDNNVGSAFLRLGQAAKSNEGYITGGAMAGSGTHAHLIDSDTLGVKEPNAGTEQLSKVQKTYNVTYMMFIGLPV